MSYVMPVGQSHVDERARRRATPSRRAMSLHETELETAAATAAGAARRRDGKHDDIMRSGDGGRRPALGGQTSGRGSHSPGRRRRLLRDGSISRDRLNLDGRRNKIIDVFARGTLAYGPLTRTGARTHNRTKHRKYSYDTNTALAELICFILRFSCGQAIHHGHRRK